MKRAASVERASRSSASSRRRKQAGCPAAYIVCVDNESNPESPERRKIYRAMPDADAAKHGYVRVVDESGEGYLYPEKYFIPVARSRITS
jgi:hypothetical protein